jgi:hypothetical protein
LLGEVWNREAFKISERTPKGKKMNAGGEVKEQLSGSGLQPVAGGGNLTKVEAPEVYLA